MTAAFEATWRPVATPEVLAMRARLLRTTRAFFEQRAVMEVDTPACVNAGVTDVHIQSVRVQLGTRAMFLHTSPEYAMKRLLAAGCGDIYQLCHVVRSDERSPLHNPEFMLLEWYRCGFSMPQLIDEVTELLNALMRTTGRPTRPLRTLRYRDAFATVCGIDPIDATIDALRTLAITHGLDDRGASNSTRDELLDFLMGVVVGPTLGHDAWLALTHYPASQAALARLDPDDARFALRFEMYGDGIELANGFVELADAQEQAARFARDATERERCGAVPMTPDPLLLAALRAGLPHAAGVAVGFDRCVMIACGERDIARVMPFTTEHA